MHEGHLLHKGTARPYQTWPWKKHPHKDPGHAFAWVYTYSKTQKQFGPHSQQVGDRSAEAREEPFAKDICSRWRNSPFNLDIYIV